MNHEAKLKELLRNLASVESQLFVDGSKEFIKILKSDLGPEFLRTYLLTSSKLIEICQAWESRKGKPGFLHILNLVAAILKQDVGVDIGLMLDKFAMMVIKEKMGDLYKELNSKEGKRQNATLLLLASIVRRNSQLAWEVAKVFDFKLAGFPKLAEVRLRAKKVVEEKRKSHSTRKAFVGFAMAFLEVGNPRLLRGILQQREMYSGVLRGLGNDDEETVVYILSILRDRVLVPESLVHPGLRSVLFGSVTLEQLASISGRVDFGDAPELAHNVLLMACTDPANGLMPDLDRKPSPLRGNLKRLVDLMKKLKATEVEYHKSLLLAVVKGRPTFGSAYLDEFPYSLEDLASHNWFAAISLAADVISSVSDGLSFGFLDKPPAFDSQPVQSILKCIAPRPFTRLVINKGLLHTDCLVKHGTLKLVVEALKLLDSLMNSFDSCSHANSRMMHSWEALKAEIQNGVRMSLPDPQVLLSLLSPLHSHFKRFESSRKRKVETEIESEHHANPSKRLKSSAASEDLDIVISGINSSEVDFSGDGVISDSGGEQQSENGADTVSYIRDLWGLRQCSTTHMDPEDGDTYFFSKILESLTIYYRTMPMATEGLSDLFKFLPNNPLPVPTILQQCLLKLLNEHVSQFSKDATSIRTPPQMYKHLFPFIVLLMGSPVRQIREHAYALAKASMLSTGAFDNNAREICAWFTFVPGNSRARVFVEDVEAEIFQKLSSVIVSFLCDAVSTTGNNLYKYMELLKHYIYDSEGGEDLSPEVSPFIICVLEKCLRLLSSESGSFTIPQKSLVSLYVCNTIKYILDTQVNAGTLSFLIDRVLSEKFENFSSRIDVLEPDECPCEWRPLKNLLHFARDILHQQCYNICSNTADATRSTSSFTTTLENINRVLRSEYHSGLVGLTVGFSFSLACTRHTEILQNFPLVLSISSELLEVPFSVLSSIFFLESSYLADVSKLWPDLFFAALDNVTRCKEKEEIFCKVDLDSTKSASVAFAQYLRSTPFCVLFSSIAQSSSWQLFEQLALKELLLDKLIGIPSDHMVSSLCYVLFWFNHARSCYRPGSSDDAKVLSEICFILAEHLLKQLLDENMSTVSPTHVKVPCAAEVAEIILSHHAVTASLDFPLSGDVEFPDSVFGESLDILLGLAKEAVHRMDHNALNLIKIVSELLSPMCLDQLSEQVVNGRNRISRAFEALEQKLFLIFKTKFDACIKSKDFRPLVPTFYVLYTLIRFISPFRLLELVNWCFSRIELKNTTFNQSSKRNALFVGLHLASCTFDFLSAYMEQPYPASKLHTCSGGTKTEFDVLLFERIYFQVLEISCHLKLDIADKCLLKAVKVVNMQKSVKHPYLPNIMVLSRVVASTPVDIISYCLHNIGRTKADLLYHIAGMSSLHLSVFGFMFSEVLDKSSLVNADGTEETCKYSDEELVMLLPASCLYLSPVTGRFGGHLCKPFQVILSLYARILLDDVCKWKIFVSDGIFEGLDGSLTASTQELSSLFSDSLLGKAILMVRDHLASSEDMVKLDRRLNLFDDVCPSRADDTFDCVGGETGLNSLKQPLEFVNRVVGYINFCRMLLFSDSQLDSGDISVIPPHAARHLEKSRIRFFRMLISSWMLIVKKFPENNYHTGNIDGKNISLFRFLEVFVMQNVLDLTKEIRDSLIKLDSLPLIEQLVKSVLLYRFGDPVTLKMLRTVLTSLSHGNFSCVTVMQHLLAHSKFAESIHLTCQSFVSTQFGLVFTPMHSIIRLLVIPRTDLDALIGKNKKLVSEPHQNLLELVKLVRLLFHIYVQQRNVNFGEDTGVNSRELVYLLLSSYGATCTELDMEIYNLMLEIESNDKSSAGIIAQMDYIWGIASLKVKKAREQDKDIQSVDSENMESFEERQKIKFRENLPVDPKVCAQTVLYFPYDRSVNGGSLSKIRKTSSTVMHETCSSTDKLQIYDPVFILRFSIHCLSRNYIEPVEFASLGLLAVTFASLSSPDEDMRKLGYEALAKFKSALENCQKKKDVVRLRLLVTYLQNGIEEPWQRLPSIIAIFFAEASLVLLDPSHDNHSSINKYLINSPSVSMKAIPLFQNLFWSSSITFRADRLWMLRLLYVGLNTEDDAQTYIKNSIFETLMGFYSSPLSDDDSKELIIQIVKKAGQLHRAIWFLVEHCGLILWLSSIISSLYGSEREEGKKFTLAQLPIILEVVSCITSPRNIIEWLQKHAMEQLSELSSHLFKLLVGNVDLIKDESTLCNSILKILTLVLKISQKRKIYQPHFTLSEEGLFQLYEAVELCSKTKSKPSMGSGLEAVLMSTPPVAIFRMGQEKLSQFLRWAVTTAIQSESGEMLQTEDSGYHLIAVSGKNPPEESLASKLLRWLTASAIVGKISSKLSKVDDDSFLGRESLHSLLSWLGSDEKGLGENSCYGCDDVLAASIFYLLQLLGFSHSLLPSTGSALCLLLLSDSSELDSLIGPGVSLPLLCSKIHCPHEANPAWRWSYYQPWRDVSAEKLSDDAEKLDEIHACERLLIVSSNVLIEKSGFSHSFALKDVENLGVYDWERSLIQSQ